MSKSQVEASSISGRTVVSKQGAAIRVVRLELSKSGREALRSTSTGLLTTAERDAQKHQSKKLQTA